MDMCRPSERHKRELHHELRRLAAGDRLTLLANRQPQLNWEVDPLTRTTSSSWTAAFETAFTPKRSEQNYSVPALFACAPTTRNNAPKPPTYHLVRTELSCDCYHVWHVTPYHCTPRQIQSAVRGEKLIQSR